MGIPEHTHALCEYCGLTNYRCTRSHRLEFKDVICGSCEDAERGDLECYQMGGDEDYAADQPTQQEA